MLRTRRGRDALSPAIGAKTSTDALMINPLISKRAKSCFALSNLLKSLARAASLRLRAAARVTSLGIRHREALAPQFAPHRAPRRGDGT